jgi:formate-dependent nitrite reductase membrane component NrfD
MTNKKANRQQVWNWKIAAYLFLAGVGSGVSFVGALAHLVSPGFAAMMQIGLWLGIPLVIAGILFLVSDLGQPTRFTKALSKPGTSWISRGSWILTILLVISVVLFGLWIWPFTVLQTMPNLIMAFEVLIVIFAFGTMVYTGLLLGASKPIPFWSTPTLPVLFTVSATAAGLKGSSLMLTLGSLTQGTPLPETIGVLSRVAAVFIAIEIAVFSLHLWGTSQTETGKFSSNRLLSGELAFGFWAGYVTLGLAVPLIVDVLISGIAVGLEPMFVLVASTLGLVGGLMLRLSIVYAGAKAPVPTFGGLYVIPENM